MSEPRQAIYQTPVAPTGAYWVVFEKDPNTFGVWKIKGPEAEWVQNCKTLAKAKDAADGKYQITAALSKVRH